MPFLVSFHDDDDDDGNCVGDNVGGGFDDGHLNIMMRGQLVGGKIYSSSGSPDGCKGIVPEPPLHHFTTS